MVFKSLITTTQFKILDQLQDFNIIFNCKYLINVSSLTKIKVGNKLVNSYLTFGYINEDIFFTDMKHINDYIKLSNDVSDINSSPFKDFEESKLGKHGGIVVSSGDIPFPLSTYYRIHQRDLVSSVQQLKYVTDFRSEFFKFCRFK